ncbi:hypothetical protein DCC81_19010 [Chitinophaga parva]|uniref:Galactose oxidase n=1 Tax=Chitinophaga parva TaxID=2169414 RepID=A0A2T7BJ75_9BACT|nr:hypothetical protein [Chitinophaga parva]PUZ26313.1 hypothetical protein DCC81_19010 [Chitinophaga parva]
MLLAHFAHAQEGYGLEFKAKNIVPEQRTALAIPDVQLSAGHDFTLSFDLSFVPQSSTYFGYVFRLIDNKEQNIDLIYNVHARALQLVTGNEFSGINDYMENPGALSREWRNIRLNIGVNARQIELWSGNQLIGKALLKMTLGHSLRLLFGANHDGSFKNIDLPPMRLRDVKVYRGENLQYHFPLAQTGGTQDTDLVRGKIAYVSNPVWLQPRYHHWQPAGSWTLSGNASLAFNSKQGIVYIMGQDELLQMDVAHRHLQTIPLTRHTGAPPGNQSLYDEQHGQLYNFFPDTASVAVFDSAHQRWSYALDSNITTHFWHPALFYSNVDSAMYVIGGYGDYQYKNLLRRYHPDTRRWDTPSVHGDRFTPRYLSAVGMNAQSDTAYILGGYGSIQGEQLLNPHNLYDLTVYDIRNRRYKKIYTLPKPAAPFAFAGNLVIDSMQHAGFALVFANDCMQSSLQLVKVDLQHPQYQRLGSEISFPFIDTKSDAALYYCAQTGELVAVTYYAANNKTSVVKMYTLLMPVNVPPPIAVTSRWWRISSKWRAGAAVLFLLVAGWCGWRFLRTRKRTGEITPAPAIPEALPEIEAAPLMETHMGLEPAPPAQAAPLSEIPPVAHADTETPAAVDASFKPVATITPPPDTPGPAPTAHSSVRLFGGFQVLDANGEDISRQFSPLVKELFLLILLPNIMGSHGITTERLTELLWPNMTPAAAKNNRSVNIAKLRSLLEKLGPYALVKEKGKWKLLLDEDNIHIDVLSWQRLPPFHEDPDQHLALLKNGALLDGLDYPWLDSYRNEINSQVITALDTYLQARHDQLSPALMITLCNCMLQFDALSEDAVIYKCRALVQLHQHASARKIYQRFQEEYLSIYGEKFERDYAQSSV